MSFTVVTWELTSLTHWADRGKCECGWLILGDRNNLPALKLRWIIKNSEGCWMRRGQTTERREQNERGRTQLLPWQYSPFSDEYNVKIWMIKNYIWSSSTIRSMGCFNDRMWTVCWVIADASRHSSCVLYALLASLSTASFVYLQWSCQACPISRRDIKKVWGAGKSARLRNKLLSLSPAAFSD